MIKRPLTRADLLKRVGRYLDDRGVHGELCLVGGAAIALAFDARRTTRDIDGVFVPTTIIREASVRVAESSDLVDDPDWLNDAAKGLLPAGDVPEGLTVLDVPGLRVISPPADFLLATKVFAARADRDDIRLLARLVGVNTADPLIDALVAAAAAFVGIRRYGSEPTWTTEPGRVLHQHIWHPGPPGFLAWSLAHAPALFKSRGLLVEEDSLRSV